MKSQVQIYFKDGRATRFLENVHQILMIGVTDMSFAINNEVVGVPYDEIREIRVRFVNNE